MIGLPDNMRIKQSLKENHDENEMQQLVYWSDE